MTIEPLISPHFEVLRAELGPFARRVIEESLLTGLPASWLRRAADFEAARPRPGDFNGRASAADLAARDRRCSEAAAVCWERAELLRLHSDVFGVEVSAAVDDALHQAYPIATEGVAA